MKKSDANAFLKKINKRVCFMSSVGHKVFTALYYDMFLAHALMMRGSECQVLLCDKDLYPCFYKVYAFKGVKECCDEFCRQCRNLGQSMYEGSILENNVHYFSQYDDEKDIKGYLSLDQVKALARSDKHIQRYEYEGINIGESVIYPQEDCLNKVSLDYDNLIVLTTIQDFINRCIYLKKGFEKYLDLQKPNVMVINDLCHNMQNLMYRLCRKRGIEVCTYEFGYEPYSFFAARNKYIDYSYPDVWREISAKALSEEDEAFVKHYSKKRMKGDNILFGAKINHSQEYDTMLKEIGVVPRHPSYVMFTNNPYDTWLDLAQGNCLFEDMKHWAVETVRCFIKNGHQLIIKPHPTEQFLKKGKNDIGISDYLKQVYGDGLPDNITILPDNTRISPYKLMGAFDYALVYYGTLAMELSVLGKVVISVVHSHYANKGFTLTPKTLTEYEMLLNGNMPRELSAEQISMAKKYYAMIFRDAQIRIPEIGANNVLNFSRSKFWNIQSFDDVMPGKSHGLDIMCNGILNGDEFISNYGTAK